MKASHRIAGLFAIVISSVLLIIFTFAYQWYPDLITDKAGNIDTLYKFLTSISIPFWVIVTSVIIYCVIEFRANDEDPDNPADGAPIHGNTRLEIIWTSIPLIVVLALGIYSWIILDKVEAKQSNELAVKVVGQQFIWNFEYPKEKVKTSRELVVPVNRALVFSITSVDVVHSFWVPNAALKRDATDGHVTTLRFRPTKKGTYPIICSELCGVGHAVMRTQMRVVSPEEFDKWIKEQSGSSTGTAGGGADNATADGKAVFIANGCGACHKLSAANATGVAGPPLDGIGSKGADFVHESIVKPDADITPGYSKGVMPDTFASSISKPEMDALVKFIVDSGK